MPIYPPHSGNFPIVVIRNSNASSVTFPHDMAKLRLAAGVDVTLAQHRTIMFVAASVWQQTATEWNSRAMVDAQPTFNDKVAMSQMRKIIMDDDKKANVAAMINSLSGEVRDNAMAIIGASNIGLYEDAGRLMHGMWKSGISAKQFKEFCSAINPVLAEDQREITIHGIYRSFRFWTIDEKVKYLTLALELTDSLREKVSPNVCLGYGTALAIARSSDLIPHDDDIDILVVLPKTRFGKFLDASRWVVECIGEEDADVRIHEENLIHYRRGGIKVDIFVAVQEGDFVASYPGPRYGIKMADMFPARIANLFGVGIPVPFDNENYLGKVYGSDWREPNPFFSHKWDKAPYADLF